MKYVCDYINDTLSDMVAFLVLDNISLFWLYVNQTNWSSVWILLIENIIVIMYRLTKWISSTWFEFQHEIQTQSSELDITNATLSVWCLLW